MFRPSAGSSGSSPRPDLLCPLLTSTHASRHLTISVAQGTYADLPGYCAPTFTLMPVGSTSQPSVQVSGFDGNGRLARLRRLISASCSSGQRFAFGFLQIRSRPRHPCRSANSSPCRASRGLSPPSKCALPGAPKKSPTYRKCGADRFIELTALGSSFECARWRTHAGKSFIRHARRARRCRGLRALLPRSRGCRSPCR